MGHWFVSPPFRIEDILEQRFGGSASRELAMTPISNAQVTIWQVGNSLTPAEGPWAIFTSLNFALDQGFELNGINLLQPGQVFSMVQTLYIDASQTDSNITVLVQKSGQVIRIKGRTQGYYPVVAPDIWDMVITCYDLNAVVPVALLNYQVMPGAWVTQ
jgi:hypothetical protein